MACYSPLSAWRAKSGEIVFVERLAIGGAVDALSLPCGRCIGCRLERSRQWAVRCVHEASMHPSNCFVTLTYDDVHLPLDHGLNYRHFQLFIKRLRKTRPGVRFYMCGEYGEQNGRPHYHACLFNVDFPDKQPLSKSGSGHMLYSSDTLASLWGMGLCSLGDVNFETAAYTARYVMKKITGPDAALAYTSVDADGVMTTVRSEFNKMSLKPGIGAPWFNKYKSDVYPHDRVVTNGKAAKPPRRYDVYLSRLDPDQFEQIQQKRVLAALPRRADGLTDRLAVREAVAEAALTSKIRPL